MRRMAKANDGKCLSSRYISTSNKLQWECKYGHKWRTMPKQIIKGRWCPECGGSKKLSLQDFSKIAQQNGGKCLSRKYHNINTKLKWQCQLGHIWEATPNKIKQGRWCPKCGIIKMADAQRGSINDAIKLAKMKGGKCLSTEYKTARTKLKWQCSKGHIWEAPMSAIKNSGTWCPMCSGNIRLNLSYINKIALDRGGKCLSKRYINNRIKLNWKCHLNHTWRSSTTSILGGTWCPECARLKNGDSQRLNIIQMKTLALKRGGQCLSNEYKNSKTPLIWQCKEGHIWQSPYLTIASGSWCPECSSNIGEKYTRAIFEETFQAKFPKVRPNWLINSRGNKMELDGYCEKYQIAFEYQGRQHTEHVEFMHKSKKDFYLRLKDDKRKKVICKQKNIKLIQIPYDIKLEDISKFIINQCKKLGIIIKKSNPKINLRSVFGTHRLEEYRQFAKTKGGECLSEYYVNARTNLTWKCKNGHIWENTPDNIKRGQWCANCSGKKKYTIEYMMELAAKNNGICLSKRYINAHSKLKWKCSCGNIWYTLPTLVARGSWCPSCARKKDKNYE